MQLKMLTALQLVEQTMVCMLYKMGIWFFVCFCYFASILIGTGIGLMFYAVDVQSGIITQIGTVLGLSVCGYFAHKLRGSTLVPKRAGHVRVITEQMAQEAPFDKATQAEKFKQTVNDYFGDVFKLAQLERQIRGVLQAVFCDRLNTKRLAFGNQRLQKVIDTMIGILVAFVAEVILAFYIKNRGAESASASCKLALTLFTQRLDNMSKSIWALNLFMYTGYLLTCIFLLYPIGWATDLLPTDVGIWDLVLALIFGWGFKAILLESVAVAALIPVFFDQTKDQQVDTKTADYLTQLSPDYKQLG